MRIWIAGPGDAPALLAIHGLGGSGRYWRGLGDRLGGRFRIIAPDLAGFGRSDEPVAEADRSLHLADLDALIDDTIGPNQPVTIVGHSLGAVLAALWAARQVERVPALALAAPPFPSERRMDLRSRADLHASPSRRALARGVRVVWPAIAVPVGVVRGYPPATVIDFGRQSVRSRAWTLWSLWSDPDLQASLGAATATLDERAGRSLVVHARDDRTVPFDDHARWLRSLPHADGSVVARGGHQFLLRNGFEPLAGWLGAPAAAGH